MINLFLLSLFLLPVIILYLMLLHFYFFSLKSNRKLFREFELILLFHTPITHILSLSVKYNKMFGPSNPRKIVCVYDHR